MPNLACRTCGRQIYAPVALEALYADERRCPRCGDFLAVERRASDRRVLVRRVNRPDRPGPPAETGERRIADRRTTRRRHGDVRGWRAGQPAATPSG